MVAQDEMAIEAALAWVYARDIEFVRYVERKLRYRPVEEAFLDYSKNSSVQHEPVCQNWAEAWRLLRDQIVGRSIVIRGAPMGPDKKQAYLTIEGIRTPVPPPRPIPREFVPRLLLEESTDQAYLCFPGSDGHEETYWREIEVIRGSVFEAFPDVPLKRKRVKNALKAFNMNSAAAKKIAMARDALSAEIALAKPGERADLIIAWLKERKMSLVGASKSNIDRFFDDRSNRTP